MDIKILKNVVKFFTYFGVQVSTLLLDYFLFGIIIFLGYSSILAFVLAKILTVGFSLWCHIYLTFSTKEIRIKGKLIYLMQSILSPLASTTVFLFIPDIISNIYVKKILTDFMMGIINYVVLDKLVFTERK